MTSHPAAFSDVTLAILAGGEGSRMGFPKGLLRVGEKPILAYLLDRWRWPGPTALITAPGRERPPGHELFDCEWSDPVAGQGPLRGVLTALEHAQSPRVVITTVDMPGIGTEQLACLLKELDGTGCDGLMLRRNVAGTEQVEPFPFACRRHSALDVIGRRINSGRFSVHQLTEEPGFQCVAAPNAWKESVWVNLNRPEDLRRFLGS